MAKRKEVILDVELLELTPDEIIPYEKNNRDHRAYDIGEIANSIKKNGYIQPITVDENNVILTGHGRLLALKQLGYEKIRVLRVTGFENDLQKRDYRIRDNTTNGLARFDMENITLELFDLGDFSADIIDQLKFQGIEINTQLGDFARVTQTQIDSEDNTPPIQEEIIVRLGDIFQLGEHTLMCGNSLDQKDVEKLGGGEKADMVFTDPPYNVAYEGTGKETGTDRGIENDDMTAEAFQEFIDTAFMRYKENVKPSAPLYVFHASKTQREFENALEKNGFRVKNQIIWIKPTLVLGRGDYHWKHEPFFYAGSSEGGTVYHGNRSQTTTWDFFEGKTDEEILEMIKRSKKAKEKGYSTIWEIKKDSTSEYIHPTQKPIELIQRALINSSRPGDLVLDLFAGSGSTLIACEKNKRKCKTMELDPVFVQRIIKRYYEFTAGAVLIRCLNREFDFEKIIVA